MARKPKASKKPSKKPRARTTATRQTQKQVQNVRITLHHPSLAERGGPKPTPFEKPYNTYLPNFVQGQMGAFPPRVKEPLPVPGTVGPSIGTSLPLGTTVAPRPVDTRHMSLDEIARRSMGSQVDDSIESLADRGLALSSKKKDELYAHAVQLGLNVTRSFVKEKLVAMIQSHYGN